MGTTNAGEVIDQQVQCGIELFGQELVDQAVIHAVTDYDLDLDIARRLVGHVVGGIADLGTVIETIDEVLDAAQRAERTDLEACTFVKEIATIFGFRGEIT